MELGEIDANRSKSSCKISACLNLLSTLTVQVIDSVGVLGEGCLDKRLVFTRECIWSNSLICHFLKVNRFTD